MPSLIRDVSPVGTSRFERPYSPPHSITSSAVNSPSTPTSHAKMTFDFGKSSRTDTQLSTSTAPTSVSDGSFRKDTMLESHDACHLDSPDCATPEDPETWFSRFRSENDLSLESSEDCPDRTTLTEAYDLPIYDKNGKERAFGSLYDPRYAPHQRQLIIFVRYFYCPACKAYLKALTKKISLNDYFSIPVPTSIIVIGCGKPDLIPHYKAFTGCQFPIFVDPTRQLYKKLGMGITLDIGKQPQYMTSGIWAASGEQLVTLRKSLKDPNGIRKRDLLRGGNLAQIGGEFLFEDGKAIWCHRMTTYRNHTEMRDVRKLLGLDE